MRRHIAWAAELTEWVEADYRFELAAPTVVSLVCFRHTAGNDATQPGLGGGEPIRWGLT